MTDGSQHGDMLELESAINFFYDKFSKEGVTHFDLLGLAKTATNREIEAAYQKYSQEFSADRIANITDPEVRKKGNFLLTRGQNAYETLVDFQKRAAYEKAGFRDPSEIVVEETDEEKAKIIYKKAKSLKTMKDYTRAVMALEEAVKLDPKKPDYYLLLGLCQSQIPDKKRAAEQNLQKAASMETWNAEPQAALGMLFYSERLVKRAEVYFRKALELEPKHAMARAKLDEIVGPERKTMDVVQDKLGKFLPTIFGKKK